MYRKQGVRDIVRRDLVLSHRPFPDWHQDTKLLQETAQ